MLVTADTGVGAEMTIEPLLFAFPIPYTTLNLSYLDRLPSSRYQNRLNLYRFHWNPHPQAYFQSSSTHPPTTSNPPSYFHFLKHSILLLLCCWILIAAKGRHQHIDWWGFTSFLCLWALGIVWVVLLWLKWVFLLSYVVILVEDAKGYVVNSVLYFVLWFIVWWLR